MRAKPEAIAPAVALMTGFAERTGLTSARPPQRYLWTDAFAVCNFLGLWRATGESDYLELARKLVAAVHSVLGRHRPDEARTGWLSGLDELQGAAHPTRGGLRIGKKLPERRPEEPLDAQLEWDRDGQYFHYLTKWMHALDQLARATGEPQFNLWARELSERAHAAFLYKPRVTGGRFAADSGLMRMYWKMSTDLSRPLVPSMGQHDPLDGYVTCRELAATAAQLVRPATGPELRASTATFAAMLTSLDIRTTDPLGLGGLLLDASRLAQIMEMEKAMEPGPGRVADEERLEELLAAVLDGLLLYVRHGDFRRPAAARLAFRELGLALGLSAVELLQQQVAADRHHLFSSAELHAQLKILSDNVSLGSMITAFWREPEHQHAPTWSEHRDINEVMLATCLVPQGFLVMSAAG